MREILFRAKSLITNEWVYGGYYCMPDYRKDEDRHIIAYQDDMPGMQTKHEPVDVNTLGQYAEWKDIDGDNIFEGMTVNQKSVLTGDKDIDFTGEVKFYDGCFWIDNGKDAVLLCDEIRENKIIEE